ncbi:MAG TPA: GTPase Era [Stellaceae bacterium]|nr:GTPase Era [Stellaceae bacterium]
MSEGPATRCGYVALIGAPNAGKSTLLNALVGAKVSIVSPKVQTTRRRVLGIAIDEGAQMIFVDTPGIFSPRPGRRLERAMVSAAWAGAEDADLVVLLVDVTRPDDGDTVAIVERLEVAPRKTVLVLNKIDLVKPPVLLGIADRFAKREIFDPIFMISGLTGDGIADLKRHLGQALPEGPWLYPEDQLSDLPERLLAAEVTREQIFLQLRNELPYASTVETDKWEERKDGSARIEQTIFVQRPSQKAIVLGEGGQRIKQIGERARGELETLLGRRVHLFLHVRVEKDWTEDRERYEAIGLDFES